VSCKISVPKPSFRSIFESPWNERFAEPTDLTLNVTVDTNPFEVLIPGEGIPPWNCNSPVMLLKLGGEVQIPIMDLPTEGETTWSLSVGNLRDVSMVFMVCPLVSK